MLRISENRKARARKQAGFVVTAELLLITTILGLGLLTGLTKVRDQTLAELSDTGAAIGTINQSYTVAGTTWLDNGTPGDIVAATSSFAFGDQADSSAGAGFVGGDNNLIKYNPAPTPSTDTSFVAETGIRLN